MDLQQCPKIFCNFVQKGLAKNTSVTRDTEKMWQVGVNVTKEGEGKGIGAYVTSLLKERLLERGILPFYSTVESHIKSQKVAFQSGFEPVFYEMFSASK